MAESFDTGSARKAAPGRHLFRDAFQDLRFAGRSFRRSPGFAVISVITIALGIAATSTVFTLINALILRPLPLSDPERVVAVTERRAGSVTMDNGYVAVPLARYEAYRDASTDVFTGLAAYRYVSVALRTGDAARAATGVLVTGNYFDVLGLRPEIGRFFASDDEPTVVLSHRVWRSQYGGDPGIAGRTVYLDSRPFTVAGVAPPGFGGTLLVFRADVWVPFRGHDPEFEGAVFPFGRLRPGVDARMAAGPIDALAKQIPPERNAEVRGAFLEPVDFPTDLRRGAARYLWIVEGMAGLVLLIASANLAGVLLARALGRRREIAVRLAIGAGRGRLVRQLLTETLVLFLAGAVGGIALAYLAIRLVASIPLPVNMAVQLDLSPDPLVLLFALGAAGGTGIIFGLAPALQASRLELLGALKTAGWSAGSVATRGRVVFVAGQVAAAVVLLVGAGLFLRALQKGMQVDLGFEADGVVVATTNLDAHGYDEERGRAFYASLVERVTALPGVEAVGLARLVPVAGSTSGDDVSATPPGASEPTVLNALRNTVDPGFFEALRVPIVRGRAFTDADRAGDARVVVINETLARRLWPDTDPLGKTLRTRGREVQVIGVARDGRYWQVWEPPQAFVYHPFSQDYGGRMALHVRAPGDAAATLEAIRQAVRALDANVAVERAAPLTDAVGMSILPQRLGAWLIGAFGLIGLILAVLGVYSVLAFQVAQRVREIGVRIALGASVRGILRLVVRRGLAMALPGAAFGLLLAAGLTRYLRNFLLGVDPLDPLTFAGVAVVLVSAALLGSYVPARRAARISPLDAMRAE